MARKLSREGWGAARPRQATDPSHDIMRPFQALDKLQLSRL